MTSADPDLFAPVPPPPAATPSDDQSLAKANEAIAIRPKRGKLTLLSRRIYNALLYHSQRQGVEKAVYQLPLTELIGDARFSSNNTELLKSHLRDMQATTIEWSTNANGQNRWVSTQLLGTVTIEEKGRGRACQITWRYPDEVKERLVKPHQYTRVLLEISGQMRSYSASVLYELGARYLSSPSRLSMREDVLWWAAVLTGRSDIKEVDYRFLKRDVINKALAEVEALCPDFTLELIEHKRGRRIEDIQFRVVPKAQQGLGSADDPGRNVFDLELVGRLIRLGIRQDEAQDLYATTDEGMLRATLDHVEQRMRHETMAELRSPGAYLKDALRKGYGGVKAASPAPAPAGLAAPVPSEQDRMTRLRELWMQAQSARAKALYREMDAAGQEDSRQQFEAQEVGELATPIARAWRKGGPESRVAAPFFFQWLARQTWQEEPTDGVLLAFALRQDQIDPPPARRRAASTARTAP